MISRLSRAVFLVAVAAGVALVFVVINEVKAPAPTAVLPDRVDAPAPARSTPNTSADYRRQPEN